MVLLVEDDPQNAETLRDIVGSMDMDCRVVVTLEEVRALLASGFAACAVLQDIQIPHAAGARPHEKAGESSIALVKARWPGKRRPGIVVVTGFRSDPDFVWAMSELDVDGFCSKSNIQALPDKLHAALKKRGREDHAGCAACDGESARSADRSAPNMEPAAHPARGASAEGPVTLEMLGEPLRGRTTLRICGELCDMPDAKFGVLLRAVDVHERSAGAWSDRYELGIGEDRGMTTRVREPFKGLVPVGFQVIEGDGRKQFRLNPQIVTVATEWQRLAKHPDPTIRNIAVQALKRRARSVEERA